MLQKQTNDAIILATKAISINQSTKTKEDHLEEQVADLEKKMKALENRVETLQMHLKYK